MTQNNREIYHDFAQTTVDYHILSSLQAVQEIVGNPRYWRIVELRDAAVEMLRVPVQVANNLLPVIEQATGVRVASKNELAAAFTTSEGQQYRYPWGDQLSAQNAPVLLRANPAGMGMNIAGLYFNGPDNKADARKNGLWMVTAERQDHAYIHGYRSGAAGNVGIFPAYDPSVAETVVHFSPMAAQRGVLPENRAVLTEERGVLPESRAVLAEERGALPKQGDNCLTPAGIGSGEELRRNEGYLMVRPLSAEKLSLYQAAKSALGNKVSADDGIELMSVGAVGGHPIILFGVVGHCLSCPNAASITTPLNGPVIAQATGVPVAEFPEFAHHRVAGSSPIIPRGVDMQQAGQRVYFPA